MNPQPHLFCFGLGFSAAAVIRRLGPTWRFSGTARSAEQRAAWQARGVAAQPFEHIDLSGVTHILVSAAPDGAGDPVLNRHEEALAAATDLRWLGYLSTTGVYGDTQGAWVDEGTPPRPGQARSRLRLAAEQAWMESGLPVHVFRLAGIYGPGRSAFDNLRGNTAQRIDRPDHVFGRIHVDDIANVVAASIDRPSPGAIYNVTDDQPTPSAEVITHAAKLLGVTVPPLIPFAQANLSPMGRSFYAECRRVRNDRIKRDLGVTLLYPTYREGLAAVMAIERAG